MAERPALWLVVGARPNFVKAAPVVAALGAADRFACRLVHTGQHYDRGLSDVFFRDLELPPPDLHLGVGSGGHARQTAEVMLRLDEALEGHAPRAVVVFGDVNSTVAASLTAAKRGIPVAHVESGLRSFDRSMPEEINRMVTDRLSDLLFTTEESANRNLEREGTPAEKVHFVGNTMVDSLRRGLERARSGRQRTLERLGLAGGGYAVLTLHRPATVDRPPVLEPLLAALAEVAAELPIVFPVHPRTRARMAASPPIARLLERQGRLVTSEPLGYLEFLGLLDGARLVLTDSGGIQEETTALGVPCLTLRDNTERPVTIDRGTNRLVGSDPAAVRAAALEAFAAAPPPPAEPPPLWDGRAGERVAAVLGERLLS